MSQDELTTKFEEVSLVYRNKIKAKDRLPIKSPSDAYHIFREHWDADQINLVEECKMLLLDRQLKLMSIADISKGGFSETVVDPRVVFSIALKRRAHRIILAHNHPSETLKASKADIQLTKDFILIGKVLRIPIEDHLIITRDNYISIFENGDLVNEPSCF
jgi:DNA repair protein RadC